MKTRLVQIIGNELAVVWDDGHESYYSAEELRRECPCANCAGEADLFGRIARGPAPRYSAASFELVRVEPTGNYGATLQFADGHDWGIWTWERLRARCRCEACAPRSTGE